MTSKSVVALVPAALLAPNAAQIAERSNSMFAAWTLEEHASSYNIMQSITQAWERELTNQYLFFSRIDDLKPFRWEMIPYQSCCFRIGRAIQHLVILWRTVFGGVSLSIEKRRAIMYERQLLYRFTREDVEGAPCRGSDSYCQEDTINSLCVLEGKRVNVLFSDAPIGFEGESLHFRIATKEHRQSFTNVTNVEYIEAMKWATKLVKHFKATRKDIKDVYLLNQTGIDAGQEVDHWHLHVIFSTITTESFWGKFTVLKNLFFGPSRMDETALKNRVKDLKDELKYSPWFIGSLGLSNLHHRRNLTR